jgi:predicted RNA-binding protein Jag
LQVRDAGNTLIHEVALNPEFTGILDGTFTGLGIDEFQAIGDASGIIKGRSYDDIYDYALNVRDHDKEKAKKEAKEGIFNQYVYDGPPLEPGDYYWRVTYDINAEEGSEIWSEEFKFTIQAHDLSPGQSLRLKDTDLASGISVSGEVVNVYPGGFTLATEQGFVNLRTDTDTVIHSSFWSPSDPNANPNWGGLYTAVPLGWKAMISMDEPPYIVGKALVPYESIPVVNSVVRRIVLNGHTTCTVVGQTDTGKIAVSCHAGDYMELNAVDVPADADKIVFIRAYKECEVMEISSEGPAQLECEDGVTMTLDESLKKGQVILVPGKSPKLISDATHLHEHITEFGIHATSMNDQGFTAVLESYGLQSDESSDVGFEQTMAEASPEVQEYLQTITLFHDMVADIPLSLISDDNDFIFDASDIYTLEEQLEKVVGSYEYIVDLMVNKGLNNLSKESRDEVIADIKSRSTQLHPWSELKTKLTEAVYFLGQRNLIEFVSVMDGTMKK